ncbi:MAG: hypothetical protein M3437_00565 [Chloroflexota bacterium]|nr:hypothetical protein [Chloroflexota bacterium]MDQ5866353.1 hypothetical protein [Chloroflexota bacterium]
MHTIEMEEVTFAHMLTSPRQDTIPVEVAPQWQLEALEEYEESLQPLEVRMRRDLATRVKALTGRRIAQDNIYTDAMCQVAGTTVDGIVFKLMKENLVVVRSCVHCGCSQFASMPITNRAELGYVLSEWEPRCAGCQEEDSTHWIYTD